jgi:glucose/arabinose dehydrogenase
LFFGVPALLAALTLSQEFRAADTARLLDSPDAPLVLQVEKAFGDLYFPSPVQVTTAGDRSGRLYVATVRGQVFSFDPADASPSIFLDLRDRVRFGGDSGLMDLAFPPWFAEDPSFYVYYCARSPGGDIVARLSRFSLQTGNRLAADPDSEEVLLSIPQPHNDHKAGCIRFGPGGLLYFATGDGGLRGQHPTRHAQDQSSLLGTMIRIDVRKHTRERPYAIPADNPFVGDADVRDEIWAFGLRAP